MKVRKILSLALALALCLGLSVPALAYELPESYHIYQCYNGFASLQDFTGDELNGYVDQTGKVVIPCIYGRYYGAGDTEIGHFHNGRVWVLKKDYWMDLDNFVMQGAVDLEDTWEVAQLDEQGNMVVPWTTVPAHAEGLHMVSDGGYCNDCGGSILEQSTEVQMPEPTRYKSTAKLTAVGAADMDYGCFTVTVTNDTDNPDSGTVALVLASSQATVSFLDYNVPAHSSRSYEIGVVGHVANTTLQLFQYFNSWEGMVNASIITFESDDDLAAYQATVPVEQNTQHCGGIILQLQEGTELICYGQPGDAWIYNYAGITRTEPHYQYPDDNHELCAVDAR